MTTPQNAAHGNARFFTHFYFVSIQMTVYMQHAQDADALSEAFKKEGYNFQDLLSEIAALLLETNSAKYFTVVSEVVKRYFKQF